jgi:acetylornithine deacetylase/succinyl-diaminopimelate desuccinylase-like protein
MNPAEDVLRLARELIRFDTSNAVNRPYDGPTGNETAAAEHLADYLSGAGVEVELVARESHRANLVARIRGDGTGPSLAFVGHTDVVPAHDRGWTHPPFQAIVDDDGYLHGRGALDMKGELAARAVAVAALAREGFRPRGDLWFLAAADEEDGTADVGMRWLLESCPEIRPDIAVNEGGGELLRLADGRSLLTVSVGEKGTLPARITALGEAGHASRPTLGVNAIPTLARLIQRIERGVPMPAPSPWLEDALRVLLTEVTTDLEVALAQAAALHPTLSAALASLSGTTMTPTMLSASEVRNVIPDRAWVELDCRLLPGTTMSDVEASLRARLGNDLPYDLSWPEALVPGNSSSPASDLMAAVAAFARQQDPNLAVLPLLDSGFTDSVHLRAAAGTVAYGINPYMRTPSSVLATGVHNVNERVHVDDLTLSVDFHTFLAHQLLGRGNP